MYLCMDLYLCMYSLGMYVHMYTPCVYVWEEEQEQNIFSVLSFSQCIVECLFFILSEAAKAEGRTARTTNVIMGGTVTGANDEEWKALNEKVLHHCIQDS